jgi:hypothetical protein
MKFIGTDINPVGRLWRYEGYHAKIRNSSGTSQALATIACGATNARRTARGLECGYFRGIMSSNT